MGRLITLKNLSNIQVSIEPEYVNESGNKTLRLIDTLCYIVNNTFKIDEKPLIIIFNKNADTPVYLSEQGTITLTAGIDQYATIIYQLSHELCHFGMVNPVPSHMKWFEESLCELSSYYFLLEMYSLCRKKFIETNDEEYKYYPEFLKCYIINSEKYEIFHTHNVLFGTDENLVQQFYNNPYMREKNRYIAIKLLPVFQITPELWKAIPYLGLETDVTLLYVYLQELNNYCKQNIGVDISPIYNSLTEYHL
jgi:hypothetical protein